MTLRVTVYSNTGPQGYTELCSFETEGYGFDSAKYADLDGDGADDIIAGETDANRVTALLSRTSGCR